MAWAVTGNIRGPQGPTGPKGDAGATGPQGPEGPPGPNVLNDTMLRFRQDFDANHEVGWASDIDGPRLKGWQGVALATGAYGDALRVGITVRQIKSPSKIDWAGGGEIKERFEMIAGKAQNTPGTGAKVFVLPANFTSVSHMVYMKISGYSYSGTWQGPWEAIIGFYFSGTTTYARASSQSGTCPRIQTAYRLSDNRLCVIVGEFDDAQAYQNLTWEWLDGYYNFSSPDESHAEGAEIYVDSNSGNFGGYGVCLPGGGWKSLSFQNGWTNYANGFAYGEYKKVNGVVYLRGLVHAGASGSIIANLPAQFRPNSKLLFTVASNDSFGRIDIHSNGDIQAYRTYGWVTLSDISFVGD